MLMFTKKKKVKYLAPTCDWKWRKSL